MRGAAPSALVVVGLVLALAAGCRAGAPVDHYTDLIEQARQHELLDGESVRVLTWDLGGDHRPLLFQHPPSRIALGPLPEGDDCRLRFAIGISSPAWEKSDGVEFRVILTSGDEEDREVAGVLFEGLANWPDRSWRCLRARVDSLGDAEATVLRSTIEVALRRSDHDADSLLRKLEGGRQE